MSEHAEPSEGWLPPRGARVWVGGNDRSARRVVNELLEAPQRPATGPVDWAAVTPEDAEEAVYFSSKLAERLTANGQLWLIRVAGEAPDHEASRQMQELGFVLSRRAQITDRLVGEEYRRPVPR